jgi:Na+:H+ antiporter, NhaA family
MSPVSIALWETTSMQPSPLTAIREFFRLEAAGGILLVLASALGLLMANSPIEHYYHALLGTKAEVRIGDFAIAKPFTLWINDGLMAVFFLLVGLEIKRELMEGELSSREQAMLPALAAIGGMAIPAGIYVLLNQGVPENLNGWAIPSATDIAFSLGVMTLLGSRVPLSLKVLLTAIAIFDDLGAILIIAIFYSTDLSLISLSLAAIALTMLLVLNLIGVRSIAAYVVVGIFLWVCVLKSGVHATLAGVALAAAIPLSAHPDGHSPLKSMEHSLHSWVAYGVLPIFGFANAGVSFSGMGLNSLLDPIALGIALGLFLGKQAGIFGTIWLAIRIGIARLPQGATWAQVYGMAVLCGIGFTMSLFIGSLAWDHSDFYPAIRLGVLGGSLASAVLGYLLLRAASQAEVSGRVAPVSAKRSEVR